MSRSSFLLLLLCTPWSCIIDSIDANSLGQKLLDALLEEDGLPTLIRVAEDVLTPQDQRETCTHHAEYKKDGNLTSFCLTPDLLDSPPLLMNFSTFVESSWHSPQAQWRELIAIRLSGGWPHWPFLCPHHFLRFVDGIQESHDRKDPARTWHLKLDEINSRNRSIFQWNLNAGDPDLQYLKELLLSGAISKHFFLMAVNHDRHEFPQWLLDHPLLLLMFSVNVPSDLKHPKVVPLPIGGRSGNRWFKVMLGVRNHRPPPTELLYVNFAIGNNVAARAEALEAVNRSIGGIPYPHNVSHIDFLFDIARHRFVLSPPGNGLDCYRTWETLYLGRVPIVNELLDAALFDDLPVLIKPQWQGITQDELEVDWERSMASPRLYDVGKLWAQWWVRHILKHCLLTR